MALSNSFRHPAQGGIVENLEARLHAQAEQLQATEAEVAAAESRCAAAESRCVQLQSEAAAGAAGEQGSVSGQVRHGLGSLTPLELCKSQVMQSDRVLEAERAYLAPAAPAPASVSELACNS